MTFTSRLTSLFRFPVNASDFKPSVLKLPFKYSTLAVAFLLGLPLQSVQAQEVKGGLGKGGQLPVDGAVTNPEPSKPVKSTSPAKKPVKR